MSDLLNLQLAFPPLVAKLLDKIYADGYQCTFGEAWRTPQQAAIYASEGKGVIHSEHINRLAIDLNLFKDGVYLTDSASYDNFGAFWKTLHPLARYGGDFTRRDGNHFSLEFGGVS